MSIKEKEYKLAIGISIMWRDFKDCVDYHDVKFLLIFISVMAFFLGLMLVDYGATFKDMRGIVAFQSLAFDNIDPRVTYHSGILLVVSAFLTTYALSFHCVVKLVRVRV
jgi:hypothetical protein